MMKKSLKVYIVAGEPSGDILGGHLMAALNKLTSVRFFGVGGTHMKEAGLNSLFPMADLSIMGIFEVIPHIPRILKRLNQTYQDAIDKKPDVVVTIDSPGFCLRLARKLKKSGIPVIHYSLPTVWAWRRGRAKKCRHVLTHALALLPMEPPYFEVEGLPTTFVGHPLVEAHIEEADGSLFRKHHKIPPSATVLCLLPGSREGEITKLLPTFSETIKKLKKQIPNLFVVVQTFEKYIPLIEKHRKTWECPSVISVNSAEKYQGMKASNFALAASGTVAIELALAQIPMVIGYKINPLTYWIVRSMVYVRHVCLVNILLNRSIVPECLQDACSASKLSEKLLGILKNPQQQLEAFVKFKQMLRYRDEIPSMRAAKTILKVLEIKPDDKDVHSKSAERDKSALKA